MLRPMSAGSLRLEWGASASSPSARVSTFLKIT
jgi:hypothetical protein